MKNSALTKLQTLSSAGKLPHAWLFTGADPNGQLQLAQNFSAWLLCSNKQLELPCGQCRNCQLYKAGTHPDLCNVTVQEDNTAILVDEIRTLNDFVCAKPQLALQKIVIIYPAEKMNLQAANALLKTLEEPPAQTLVILLARHCAMLLPTIVSRCTMLRCDSSSNYDTALNAQIQQICEDLYSFWFLKALTASQLAESWVKRNPTEVLYWFELVLADLLVTLYTRDKSLSKFAALYKDQNALLQTIDLNKFWIMLQKVQQARYWFGTGMRPNVQLVIEDMLLL
jgi:DNA polymerase III delta' subunit